MIEVWTAVILGLVVFVLAIYYYGFRNLNFFEKHGIPCIPPVPFLGNMAPIVLRKKTMKETMASVYNYDRDAKYVGFFDCGNPVVILRDPELIKSVAIKNFDYFPDRKMLATEVPDRIFEGSLLGLHGQRWKDVRARLSPSYTSKKTKTIFKSIKECTNNLIEYMKIQSVKSTVFEMKDVLMRCTNDVIVTTAFGISVDSLKDRDNELYRVGKNTTNFSGLRSLRLFILRIFPRISKLLGVSVFGKKTAKFYENMVKTTVATRDAEGIVRPDMLQLMMQARYSDENNVQQMTVDEMVPHAFVFYFAGFDTTSNLLCFVVHEIAVNPEVQKRLQAEVDEVFERCNGDVTYEALHSMEYLDAVINETLRLQAPVVLLDRLCRRRFELPPAKPGLKPFTIEPGYTIGLPFAAISLDSKYFPNPDQFDPERFMGSKKNDIDSATFMPFGIGPRICIGMRFALMETKLVIFELLANFTLAKCSKTNDPLRYNRSSALIVIDGGVWIQAEPRIR